MEMKILKLPAEAADTLESLRAGRDWGKFIDQIEERLNKTSRNPLPLPFMENVEALNLDFNEVCLVCRSRSNLPEKLIEIDYVGLLFTTFKDIFSFAGLDLAAVRERLAALSIQPVAAACPICHSYCGTERPEDVLWDILYYKPILPATQAEKIDGR